MLLDVNLQQWASQVWSQCFLQYYAILNLQLKLRRPSCFLLSDFQHGILIKLMGYVVPTSHLASLRPWQCSPFCCRGCPTLGSAPQCKGETESNDGHGKQQCVLSTNLASSSTWLLLYTISVCFFLLYSSMTIIIFSLEPSYELIERIEHWYSASQHLISAIHLFMHPRKATLKTRRNIQVMPGALCCARGLQANPWCIGWIA